MELFNMDKPHYFSPKLTGGMHNSLGLDYQDACALFLFFNKLLQNENQLLSMGIEMTNDFTIHEQGRTFSVQVKKQTLSICQMKNILQNTYIDENHLPMIVVTGYHDNLAKLMKLREQYKNILESDYDESWKQTIKKQFREELAKHELGDLYSEFLRCEFYDIPQNVIDIYIKFTIWSWMDKQNLSFNLENFINFLKSKIQTLRTQRAPIRPTDINSWIQMNTVQSVAQSIISDLYQSIFIQPSQIITILGETKEEILTTLENKLKQANEYYQAKKYSEARDIYVNLSSLYEKEEVFLQCAILSQLCNDFSDAINFCNKVLDNNSKHFVAFLIKGTCLGELQDYHEAIIQLNSSLLYKETPEVHYNLATVYFFGFKDYDKAIEHYTKCLTLKDSNYSAHLNISICYFYTLQFEKALYHVNESIKLSPEKHEPYGRKGELYRYLGLYDDAIEYFYQCLNIDPINYQALLGISLCFVEKGQLSEAIIFFTKFFNTYSDKFFKEQKAEGNKCAMIDIGWERTLFSIFERVNQGEIHAHIDGVSLPIKLKSKTKDYIFVGCNQLSDDTGSSLYPIVGKVFEKEEDFRQVIQKIKELTNLFQFFDKPQYINNEGEITIRLVERTNYILIDIIFADTFYITGVTNGKSGGFEAFIDYFEEYGQCRIHLECIELQEVFIIDCLDNVRIEKLL